MPPSRDPYALQEYLAAATLKAAADLEAALLRLPEDRRDWSPGGDARSAANVVAECAILNASTADLVRTRAFPEDFDLAAYQRARGELAAGDTATLLALLQKNTGTAVAAIRAAPAEDLGVPVAMPWGPMTLAQVIAYPHWNMSYHEGQINYIASMLGLLK